MAIISIRNMTHGECSPQFRSQTDLEFYNKSCQTLQNCLIGTSGSWGSRFGTYKKATIPGDDEILNAFSWHYSSGDNIYNFIIIVGLQTILIFNQSTWAITTITGVNFSGTIRGIAVHDRFIIFGNFPTYMLKLDSSGTPVQDTFAYVNPPTYQFDNKYKYETVFTLSTVEVTDPDGGNFAHLEITTMGTFGGFTPNFVGGTFRSLGLATDTTDTDGSAVIMNYESSTQVGVRIDSAFRKVAGWTSGPEGIFKGAVCVLTEQLYSETKDNWPTCGTFYDDRLYTCGGKLTPKIINGSGVGEYEDFYLNVGNDSDAIQTTLDGDGDSIINVISSSSIQFFTNKGIYCNEAQVITPKTISSVRLVSEKGSTSAEPIMLDKQTLFCNVGGKSVSSLYLNEYSAYKISNISFYSSHLIKNPISMAAYDSNDKIDTNIAFLVNPDGSISMYQTLAEQNIEAWSNIQLLNGDKFIHALSSRDKMFFITERNTNFFIEEFTIDYALDCMVDNLTVSNGEVQLGSDFESTTVSLIGKDGVSSYGDYTTDATGTFTTDIDDAILNNCLVGYKFISQFITNPLHIITQAGDNRYTKKKVSKVYVEYYNSNTFKINGVQVPTQNLAPTSESTQSEANNILRSDTFSLATNSGYTRNATVEILQDIPLRFEILAVDVDCSL